MAGPRPNDSWQQLPWEAVLVHFAEIALKGHNRSWFTRMLQRNLTRALAGSAETVDNQHDHLAVRPTTGHLGEALAAAARVMGVAYVVPVRRLPADLETLAEAGLTTFRAVAGKNDSFAVRAEGVSRLLPANALELERQVGARIHQATGATVNLTQPDVIVRFRGHGDAIYLLGPRVDGPGGLPLGAHGPVLTLFSGGIDSPVAAWLMMRRGCLTDFLHIYSQPNAEQVHQSKIIPLLHQILTPQRQGSRLFLVPYDTFQVALLNAQVAPGLELILFRRFLVRVADRLAAEHGYPALVTGDNLGQVASQTMENLVAVDEVASRPIFRPVLTHTKIEIIALAKRLGTYDLSILPYKDCCSLVARHPATKPRLETVRSVESRFPMESLVTRVLAETTVQEISPAPSPDSPAVTLLPSGTSPSRQDCLSDQGAV